MITCHNRMFVYLYTYTIKSYVLARITKKTFIVKICIYILTYNVLKEASCIISTWSIAIPPRWYLTHKFPKNIYKKKSESDSDFRRRNCLIYRLNSNQNYMKSSCDGDHNDLLFLSRGRKSGVDYLNPNDLPLVRADTRGKTVILLFGTYTCAIYSVSGI